MSVIDSERRFGGIARLYGRTAAQRLAASHVTVIGVGGVGSWAAEALARSGVGRLTLIDLDEVCLSNVNRQLHALEGTVGRAKVAVLAERLRAINPALRCDTVEDFLTLENMVGLMAPRPDAVLDAIDNARVKAALVAWCLRNKLPLVCAGGAGGKLDPTQIRVADLNRTIQDPLLAKVRKHLKRFHNLTRSAGKRYGVDCVFSTEALTYPTADGGTCSSRESALNTARMNCENGFGAVTMVTGSFGFAAAARIVSLLSSK